MAKKDFRIYCEEEYIEHLRTVADEKGISVNQLVLSLLTKKYPMPKRAKPPKTPALDIEATRQHYMELDTHIKQAEAGGARIKPKSLYTHLVAERDRLGELLNQIDNK